MSQHAKKYKKVLLRERKRHTARRISSTPSAGGGGAGGGPHPWPGVGQDRGVPHPGVPILGYPCPGLGTLQEGIWDQYPPPRVWNDKQTETITFPIFGCGRYKKYVEETVWHIETYLPLQVSCQWEKGTCTEWYNFYPKKIFFVLSLMALLCVKK